MRLLIWLWERTGTELFVTDGKWCWDEWHAFHYGRFEALSGTYTNTHPSYCYTESCYHLWGRSFGRGQRVFNDVMTFVFGGLVFIGGLYLISDLVTYFLAKGLMQ